MVLLGAGLIIVGSAQEEARVEYGEKLLEGSVTARMLRLLRLVRLAKIKQLAKTEIVVHNIYLVLMRFNVEKLRVAFYFRAFSLLLIILGTGHIVGCFWLMLGRHQALMLPNPTGWMVEQYKQESNGNFNVNKTRDFISCR